MFTWLVCPLVYVILFQFHFNLSKNNNCNHPVNSIGKFCAYNSLVIFDYHLYVFKIKNSSFNAQPPRY